MNNSARYQTDASLLVIGSQGSNLLATHHRQMLEEKILSSKPKTQIQPVWRVDQSNKVLYAKRQRHMPQQILQEIDERICRLHVQKKKQLFVWRRFGIFLRTKLSAYVGSSFHTPPAHHRNPSACMAR